jgi:hypothetical protein
MTVGESGATDEVRAAPLPLFPVTPFELSRSRGGRYACLLPEADWG